MAALAEMERDLIRERTNAELAAARARGRKGGRNCGARRYGLLQGFGLGCRVSAQSMLVVMT
jgi:DNA invertase Pin-like site-specific DNA recombinase